MHSNAAEGKAGVSLLYWTTTAFQALQNVIKVFKVINKEYNSWFSVALLLSLVIPSYMYIYGEHQLHKGLIDSEMIPFQEIMWNIFFLLSPFKVSPMNSKEKKPHKGTKYKRVQWRWKKPVGCSKGSDAGNGWAVTFDRHTTWLQNSKLPLNQKRNKRQRRNLKGV